MSLCNLLAASGECTGGVSGFGPARSRREDKSPECQGVNWDGLKKEAIVSERWMQKVDPNQVFDEVPWTLHDVTNALTLNNVDDAQRNLRR